MPAAIDRMTTPATAVAGYPVDLLRAGPGESRCAGQPHAARGAGTLVFFAAKVAGRQGDWARLDEALGKLRGRFGEADPTVASVTAFWLTVRDRHEEAAQWLARAEPVPDMAFPAILGTDTTYGLMDTARVRIYRATGREAEARRLADERLQAPRA